MVNFLQSVLDGVMIGASYALLGLGFTLIFGVLKRINLAFGASILLGAFAGAFVWGQWKLGGLAAAGTTIAVAMLAGAYVERVAFWAVRRTAAVTAMVSSFALWMQLEETTALLFPGRTYAFPPLVERSIVELGVFQLRLEYLVMFAVAALIAVVLEALIRGTRFGLAVRATTDNPAAARALGVHVERVGFIAFAISSAIGGLAMFLIAATDEQVTLHTGMTLTIKGLIAMMIGGMGSLHGAIVGGILLGVVETLAQASLGALGKDFATAGLLFAILVLRPGGLLGQGRAEREAASLRRV